MSGAIPGIDQVVANLQSLPIVTGCSEQFIGPVGAGPPVLPAMPQYAGLAIVPRSVPATNFDAFGHGQLVANVQPIEPASVDGFRQEWARAANGVADVFATFATTIGRAIADKWQGAAGTAASTAIVSYAQDASRMADASNLVARQIGLLVDSLDRTKLDLPPEPAATVPAKLAGLVGIDGWDDERRDAARQQAVQFLNTVYYGGGISPTAQGLPLFPEVSSPIAGGSAGAGLAGSTRNAGSVLGGNEAIPGSGWLAASAGSAGAPTGSQMVYPGGSIGWGGTAPVSSMLDQAGFGQAGYPAPFGEPAGELGPFGTAGAVDAGQGRSANQMGDQPDGGGSRSVGSGPDGADPDGSGKTVAADFGSPVTPGTAGSGTNGNVGGFGPAGPGPNSVGSGLGAPGGGPGSGVLGSDRIPGGGSGVLGSPVLGGVVPGSAAANRPPGAMSGRAGVSGMGMAPLGAGRGDDERERTAPAYLANDELQQWMNRQAERWGVPVLGASAEPDPPDGRPESPPR